MTDLPAGRGPGPAGHHSDSFALELPSDLRLIEEVVGHLVSRCRAFSFDGPRLELNFRVGVTEAIANAVMYGNREDPAKCVRVQVSIDSERVEVRVADEGSGFDPAAVPDPTLPANLESPGGRGIFLIRHLMDETEFNESGNEIRMVLCRVDASGGGGQGVMRVVEGSVSDAGTGAIVETVRQIVQEYGSSHRAEMRLWWCEAGSPPKPDPVLRGGGEQPGPAAVRARIARDIELILEVDDPDPVAARARAGFVAETLSRTAQHLSESRFFGRELAERYEEITLLYTISEVLGSVISLEGAADSILTEVADTLGVDRASLWLFEPRSRTLELIACVGQEEPGGSVSIDDPVSVTAAVFRQRSPLILDREELFPRSTKLTEPVHREDFLAVPVNYTPPRGETRTIGVINLVGRRSGEPFSAGDQKLITAIASQIGAAVENSRLVAQSLQQERFVREMELAHDLQVKLLPSTESFQDRGEVSARFVPAESVGGDFYHLFRLPADRLGVMIGDVSSHGFAAALIMALSMSAVAIHASEGDSPREVLRRVHCALIEELESTEMYLTLFYGVLDPTAETLTYSNAGHSHAFRITSDGAAQRLPATSPPFGIADLETYEECVIPWQSGDDILMLFTDGLSDALGGPSGERRLLEEVARQRSGSLEAMLDSLFSIPPESPDSPSDDRTAVFVRV